MQPYLKKLQLLAYCLLGITWQAFTQYADIHTGKTFLQFTGNGSNSRDIIVKNNIRRELVYEYAGSAKDNVDSTLVSVIFYDERGNVFEKWRGLNKDKLVEKYSYEFDAMDRLATLKIAFNDPVNNLAGLEVEYDTFGREVNMYQYNIDTTSLLIRHKEYNAQGQLQKLYTRINNDGFYESHQYVYDGQGRLAQINALTKSSIVMYSYEYSYNTQKADVKMFLRLNALKREVGEFVYDATKRLIKVVEPPPLGSRSPQPPPEDDLLATHNFHLYLDRIVTTPGPVDNHFIYDSDGTLFESHKRIRDGRAKYSLTRHYYVVE
ncbi:MAG: hypothetical protein V4725_04550 [Bacteroidota bacterium]